MPNPSMRGVCLDTCFLITLCSAARERHAVARQFFQYWIDNGYTLFLPTICYAEYLVVETSIQAYILENVHLLPFDAESAILAGAIQRNRLPVEAENTSRVAIKDDIKIIANAAHNHLLGIVTEDKDSMARYVRKAAETMAEVSGLKVLVLPDVFDEGSASFTDPQLPLVYPPQTP